MIARFHERYPGAYRHETYPTRDKVIPAGLFEMMVAMLDPIEMGAQFRMTNAVSMGKALLDASEKDRAKVIRQWSALEALAHPKILIPLTTPDPAPPSEDEMVIEKGATWQE